MSSNVSKKIHRAAAMHIVGLRDKLNLSGPIDAVSITRDTIEASRELYERLHSPDANITSITEAVIKKRRAASKFKKKMGFSWLL